MSVARIPATWRLPAHTYGTDGVAPDDQADCPCARATGRPQCCRSGSGASSCVGFFGATRGETSELEVDCRATDESVGGAA